MGTIQWVHLCPHGVRRKRIKPFSCWSQTLADLCVDRYEIISSSLEVQGSIFCSTKLPQEHLSSNLTSDTSWSCELEEVTSLLCSPENSVIHISSELDLAHIHAILYTDKTTDLV